MLVEGIEGLERINAQGLWLVADLELLIAALAQLGRLADAEAGLRRLEELSSPYRSWRRRMLLSLQGQVAMLRGDAAAAVDLFRSSLDGMEVDSLPVRGDLYRLLGEALREDGREPEALVVAREALEIYRTKGDVVSADRIEAFLDSQ